MYEKPKIFGRSLTIVLALLALLSMIFRQTLFFEKNQFINGWLVLMACSFLFFPPVDVKLRRAGLGAMLILIPLSFPRFFESDFLAPDHRTHLYFAVAGLAMLALLLPFKWAASLSQTLTLVMGSAAILSLLNFLFKVNLTDGRIAYSYMSPGMALSLTLLSLIVLFEEPKKGFMAAINSQLTGGQLLRVLIPVTVIIPIGLGTLRTWLVDNQNLNGRFGTTVLVLFMILLMVAAVWYTAALINKREIQRMQIARALQASQLELEAIFNNAPDAVVVLDKDAHIARWNKAAESIFGYREDDVLGSPITATLLSPKQLEQFRQSFSSLVETGVSNRKEVTLHLRGLRKDGGEPDITLRMAAYRLNDSLYVVGFIRDVTLEKEEERQKKLAEQKFLGLFESAPYANIITDNDGQIQYGNQEAIALLGYTAAELQQNRITDFMPVDMELLKTRKLTVMENRISKKDQSDFIAEIRISPIASEAGTLYSAVITDITERKETEARLNAFNEELSAQVKDKTRQLENVLERLTDGFAGLDKDLRIIYVNRKVCQILKMPASDLVGKRVVELFPWIEKYDSYQAVVHAFKSQLYTQSVDYFPPLDFFHENHIYPDKNGVTIFIRDITEKRKAQAQLEMSIERYRTFIEEAVDPVFVYSPELNRYTNVNPKAAELLGYEKEELLNIDPLSLLEPGETPPNYLTMQPGIAFRRERRVKRKNGSMVEIESSAVKLKDGSVLSFVRDISERKKSEQELLRLNSELRRLGNYLQEVREAERVHIAREIHDELGQQMTVLKMDIIWLRKNLGKTDRAEQEQKMTELTGQVDNAVKTIRKIASELRPSLLDDIGLVAAMEWHLGEFSKRTGISVRNHMVDGERPLPDSVKTNIFRILQEALTNVARHSEAQSVTVDFSVSEELVELEIADDGKGFNPLSGNNKTLGLLGMRERAHMIGAEYDINSAPGKGTRVHVSYRL